MRQRVLRVMVVVILGILCASCASGSPTPTGAPTPSTHSLGSEAAVPSTATTPTPPPIRRTDHPWHSGDFQNGIQLYWHMGGSWQKQVERANQQLDYIAGLGANSVGITFSIYADGATPTKVYTGRRTPSSKALGMLIDGAKQRGLRVMLRPTIYEANIVAEDPLAWRGSIEPVSTSDWFASYERLMLSYARLAAAHGAQELVVGTELNSLQGYSEWSELKARIRQAGFHGQLSYAYNWDAPGGMPFPLAGVDAYPSVPLGDHATVAQLTDAILAALQPHFTVAPDHLALQEVGIPSLSGMYAHPWHWSPDESGQQDFAVQANWYEAMYQVAHRAKLRGIYYWSLDSNMDLQYADPQTDYVGSFVGKPAEAVIRRCFNR